MARYASGDAGAFDELFRRYELRAYAFFLKRTKSRERAQDLYQELFLRIHRGRGHYDPSRPFAPWLFQIARRLLVDDHRRAYRGHELPADGREPRADQAAVDDQVSASEQVACLLAALSPEERYVIVASKVEGLGYPELAEQLGKSALAVRKIASRAARRLRSAAQSSPRPAPCCPLRE